MGLYLYRTLWKAITTEGGADIVKWTGVDAADLATETGSAAGTDNNFAAGSLGDKVSDFTIRILKIAFCSCCVNYRDGYGD